MSVDVPKVEETAPVATKPVETSTPAETSAPAATEPSSTEPNTSAPIMEPLGTTEPLKDEAVIEATPATEGILGYKAPGLLKQFRFVKHFFWFSEEPLSHEALDSYIKSEKAEVAHSHAAWAQETGKGVLFYAKRAEDKSAPAGLILLAEAGGVTKVGQTDFSFKVGHHTHKFEAASQAERDSWVVAIQKVVDETKDLKTDVTGRDSYKKTMEGYSASPIVAGTAATATPKKSLDATTATNAATTKETEPIKADASSASSADDAKHQKEAEKQAKKERSQSRKRNSVFGLFGKKDEEAAHKKAEKEHEKEVKKAEKEHVKEEKKIEAEHKKEEAKAEHDSSKAKEAAEAAAVAAAPAAMVAAADKKEEDKKETKPLEEVTTPTDKKSKRTSVFGGFFGKNKITSPSAEKSEKDVVPEVPAKDETPAVSETAPKLNEPIETKPIDAAAVTAPVDHTEPTVAPVTATEEPKIAEPATTAESTTAATPKTEKKSFVSGLFKKDKKDETKEEVKTNEDAVKEAPAVAPESAIAATETPAAEVTPKETETAKEERPAREKRRTSLFGSLGTLKRKTDKSPAPESASPATDDAKSPEVKREKSPLPSKIGGLFRKPSKANHIQTATENKTDATETKPEGLAPASEAATPANTTVVEPKDNSEIVGDVVPEKLHTTVHDAVTQEPSEVKASA